MQVIFELNFKYFFACIIKYKNQLKLYYKIILWRLINMEFIIKKPTSSNRTIRMPDTLIDTLGKLASEQGISFNQLVVQCCEFALEHLQPAKDEKAD